MDEQRYFLPNDATLPRTIPFSLCRETYTTEEVFQRVDWAKAWYGTKTATPLMKWHLELYLNSLAKLYDGVDGEDRKQGEDTVEYYDGVHWQRPKNTEIPTGALKRMLKNIRALMCLRIEERYTSFRQGIFGEASRTPLSQHAGDNVTDLCNAGEAVFRKYWTSIQSDAKTVLRTQTSNLDHPTIPGYRSHYKAVDLVWKAAMELRYHDSDYLISGLEDLFETIALYTEKGAEGFRTQFQKAIRGDNPTKVLFMIHNDLNILDDIFNECGGDACINDSQRLAELRLVILAVRGTYFDLHSTSNLGANATCVWKVSQFYADVFAQKLPVVVSAKEAAKARKKLVKALRPESTLMILPVNMSGAMDVPGVIESE